MLLCLPPIMAQRHLLQEQESELEQSTFFECKAWLKEVGYENLVSLFGSQ